MNNLTNECVDDCKNNEIAKFEYNNICYEFCPNDTHIFQYEYNKLKYNESNKCIAKCYEDINYIYEFNSICYKFCPEGTYLKNDYICEMKNNLSLEDFENFNVSDFFNNKYQIDNNSLLKDDIIKNITNEIINGDLNSLITNIIENEKKDFLVKDNNIQYQLTSSDHQNNNNYDNISTIALGKCEEILKAKNDINQNLSLIIFKIDYYQPGSLIPIIGYEIFHPLTKKKIKLDDCQETFINFNIPVIIDENNLFKYDPNNEYYKDECYPSTTDNGADILLNDRYNEYNDNNMALCENNCTFVGYDKGTKKVNCECLIKSKQLVISELINQTDILSYKFDSKGESSNMITMKCFYTLFTKKGLYKNLGSYILLFIILTFTISGILFYKFGYYLLEEAITEIIESKEKNNKINININETIDINDKRSKKSKKVKIKKKEIQKNKRKQKKKEEISKSFSKLELKENKKESYHTKGINLKSKTMPKNKENNQIKFSDYELNSLSYYDALKFDKRSFLKYYFYLIKVKHPIIFSFFPIKDYNSTIIKIDIFLISFSVYYFINALFFDEPTIHKIYEDKGDYNFIYLLPHILYSFLVSHTLVCIIKYFFLSEKNIYEIVKEKNIEIASDKSSNVKGCLIKKYICFYLLGIAFLIFFWYYLSSFGAVYQNTQFYIIKNTAICFSFSLIYPFVINLFPTIFRLCSLKESNRQCIYKIGKFLQII